MRTHPDIGLTTATSLQQTCTLRFARFWLYKWKAVFSVSERNDGKQYLLWRFCKEKLLDNTFRQICFPQLHPERIQFWYQYK